MRPQVYVVEGKNDASRLRQIFPNIEIISTNGSAISLDAIEILNVLQETHDIILFLDPDHAGERIRRLLNNALSNVYHAFINQEDAYSKNRKKIGIEHASEEDLRKALKDMLNVHQLSQSDITHAFLFETKLTGHKNSKALRMHIAQTLKIGYVNGKTLYHRLKMFNISQNKIIEVLHESSSKKEIRTKFHKR